MNLKIKLIKTLSHKSPSQKGILHFEGKKLLKQCQKDVIYGYILAFARWSILWVVVGGGGSWWMYISWWWVVVEGGGYILAGGW